MRNTSSLQLQKLLSEHQGEWFTIKGAQDKLPTKQWLSARIGYEMLLRKGKLEKDIAPGSDLVIFRLKEVKKCS